MEPAWQIALGTRWTEPHRHYHGVEHLRDVLDAIDLLADDGLEFDVRTVRIAAWFHDAVYDVHRDDNEIQSAELARRMLTAPLAGEVARLVLLTRHHRAQPDDVGGAVLCDADLAVLGGVPERYDRYARDVREEYAHVPDPVFRRERAAVLDAFLERPTVYGTDPARRRWEGAARRNLRTEIARLRAGTRGLAVVPPLED